MSEFMSRSSPSTVGPGNNTLCNVGNELNSPFIHWYCSGVDLDHVGIFIDYIGIGVPCVSVGGIRFCF